MGVSFFFGAFLFGFMCGGVEMGASNFEIIFCISGELVFLVCNGSQSACCEMMLFIAAFRLVVSIATFSR